MLAVISPTHVCAAKLAPQAIMTVTKTLKLCLNINIVFLNSTYLVHKFLE